MPIHFSVGFVIDPFPRSQFETICGAVYPEQNISAHWVRSGMCCDKFGCCGECIPRELICVGRGNSKMFIVSVFDYLTGDEVDISGASEIVFSVSDGVIVGGNIFAGGTERIRKTLSTSGIQIAGTGYQFLITIDPSDTELPVNRDSYWDATVTTSGGEVYTVKAGIFRVTKTNAGN